MAKGKDYVVRRNVELDKDNVEWYEANYGGSLWWLLNNLLSAFRNAHEVTPQQLIAKAGIKTREEILELNYNNKDNV